MNIDPNMDPTNIDDAFMSFDAFDGDEQVDFDSVVTEYEATGDMDFSHPIAPKADSQIAEEVEAGFLSLLESGDYSTIQSISGESIESKASSTEAMAKLQEMYSCAVSYNPAIKWYSKLAKLVGNKLRLEGDSLKLSISKESFKANILPHLADFDPDMASESPIVSSILNIHDSLTQEHVTTTLEDTTSPNYKLDSGQEDGDFEVESIEFGNAAEFPEDEEMDIIKDEVLEGVVDDPDEMGLDDINNNDNEIIDITLKDLSAKSIAEFLYNGGYEDSSIISKLGEENFNTSSRNEIMGIIKYLRNNAKLESISIKKNEVGNSDVEFPFK